MNETVVTSGWQAILLAIPLISLLGMSVFRIDELAAASRKSNENHRGFCTLDANGEPLLLDPDGRACEAKPRIDHRKAAVLIRPLPVALYRAVCSVRTSPWARKQASARRRRIHIVKH
jgi:hypothetical protein